MEQANTPGKNVIAYKAIAALLENATRMMKGKIRNYSKMIRERGRMAVSLMQNFYTSERFVTLDNDEQLPVDRRTLMIPARLTVVSGSTMPRSEVQRREESIELYNMGAIPLEDLLKAVHWDDPKDTAKRVQAGPLAGFFEVLQAIGAPPELIEYLQQISQMDPKDAQKAVEEGEMPAVPDVVNSLAGVQAPDEAQDTEIAIKEAEKEKTIMESELIREKINTEKLNQEDVRAGIEVKRSGIQLDVEQLKIERAKAATEIEIKKAMSDGAETKPSAGKSGQGPYRDKKFKSNNKEA